MDGYFDWYYYYFFETIQNVIEQKHHRPFHCPFFVYEYVVVLGYVIVFMTYHFTVIVQLCRQ